MASILLSGPASEPIALAEAREFLRADGSDDDSTIAALIAAARAHVETQTRRALIAQTWRIVRDAWPAGGRIAVTPAPLRALVAVRVFRFDGTAETVDPALFSIDAAAAPAVLAPAATALPAPGRPVGGIELDIEAGYGTTAADVPEPLRQAIRLLVAHWYEHRADGAPPPPAATALIAPYRVLTL